MNVSQLTNAIKTYAESIKFVKSAQSGDIYANLNGSPDVLYGNVNIDIPVASRAGNVMNYSVYLYYSDRLTNDNSNALMVKSTAVLVLSSIINYCGELGIVDDNYEIHFFEQKFADMLGGGYVNFNIELLPEIDDCMIDEYLEENNGNLIDRLEEAIKQYQEENAELAVLLKEILQKLNGEII